MSDKLTKVPQDPKQVAEALKSRQTEFAQAFTQIISLMMRDPKYRGIRLSDLEWLVLPAVVSGQWQIAHGVATKPDAGAGAEAKPNQPNPNQPNPNQPNPNQPNFAFPVAAALWARVSPEVDARLSQGLDKPIVLKAEDWTSGTIVWLIAIVGEQLYLQKFLEQLHGTTFKGHPVKLRGAGADGKPMLRTLDDLLKKPTA